MPPVGSSSIHSVEYRFLHRRCAKRQIYEILVLEVAEQLVAQTVLALSF